MEIQSCSISTKYLFIVALLFSLLFSSTISAQQALALDQMQWFPAGSYLGFMHIDRSGLQAEGELLVNKLIKELDIIHLRNGESQFEYMTVAMVQGLDQQRQRFLERGRKQREDGQWFFWDEIVVARYSGLGELLKAAVENGYTRLDSKLRKFQLLRQTNEESETPTWILQIAPDTVIMSNNRNHLVAAVKAGLNLSESILEDAQLADLGSLIPAKSIWFISPIRAALQKDLDFEIQKSGLTDQLEKEERELKQQPEFLIISIEFGSEVEVLAECLFEDEAAARAWIKVDPEWAESMLPFDGDLLKESITDNEGRYLRMSYIYDVDALLASEKESEK